MVNYEINDNGEDLKEFILNLQIVYSEIEISDPIFVIDNIRIHHCKGLVNVIKTEWIQVMYLPHYSPFSNPKLRMFLDEKTIYYLEHSEMS